MDELIVLPIAAAAVPMAVGFLYRGKDEFALYLTFWVIVLVGVGFYRFVNAEHSMLKIVIVFVILLSPVYLGAQAGLYLRGRLGRTFPRINRWLD